MVLFHTTLRGTIASGTVGEIFTHSMGVEAGGSAETVANAIRDEWMTCWGDGATGLGTAFNGLVTYTEATAAQVIDPLVPDLGAAHHALFTPPLVGSNPDPAILPSQNALVVSLTAGNRPDGRPFRGRFYLPPLHATAAENDGLLLTTYTDGIAVLIKDYLERLFQRQMWPVVWSRVEAGLINNVTQVRVGNRIDTMRSRRNRFPEVYSVEPVTGPQ